MRRRTALFAVTLVIAFTPSFGEAGYTLNRLVLWAEIGDPPPRLQQNPQSGFLQIVFPGPIPESGWDPVEARRLEVRGGAFVPIEPLTLLRPRDPDPDWGVEGLEASLDLNLDGRTEVVSTRTVLIPDGRNPSDAAQRVLVTISEESQPRFGDLVEGPDGAAVEANGVISTEFTGDRFPDLVIRLEAKDRSGLAFYSQAPLRYPGGTWRIVEGFSPSAFRPDRYGIFDLNRRPQEFLARLPSWIRPDDPRCATAPPTGSDGRARCGYRFDSPYLGWIRSFRVEFLPNRRILSFDLFFPSGPAAISPEQALDFLIPVLGGDFRVETPRATADGGEERLWRWRGKKADAQMASVRSGSRWLATLLRLERR